LFGIGIRAPTQVDVLAFARVSELPQVGAGDVIGNAGATVAGAAGQAPTGGEGSPSRAR
jgi:hypothetical protein